MGLIRSLLSKAISFLNVSMLYIYKRAWIIAHVRDAGVRQFIMDGHITPKQFAGLDVYTAEALQDAGVRQLIIDGHITLEQFAVLNRFVAEALKNAGVRRFIIDGHITVEQFAVLNWIAAGALKNAWVCQFIMDRHFTLEQFDGLNWFAAEALQDFGVRQLIIAGRMTIAQLGLINNRNTRRAIIGENTIQRILRGDLNVADIVGPAEQRLAAGQRNCYNDAQSTHTSSVHKSVSDSAKRLYERYKEEIKGEKLDVVISSLVDSISNFGAPIIATYNNRERNCTPSAQDCIKRIAAPDYDFVDAVSGISTRQLLALTYLAINDERNLQGGTKDDALKLLIHGLYEIERGYNINNAGITTDDKDDVRSRHICSGGTFNKIIECLVGVHPDYSIIYITAQTIVAKAKAIVLECVAKYIAGSADEYAKFLKYKDKQEFADDDWNRIWAAIKGDVKKELIEHFSNAEGAVENQVAADIDANIVAYDGNCLVLADVKITHQQPKPEILFSQANSRKKSGLSLVDVHQKPMHRSNFM